MSEPLIEPTSAVIIKESDFSFSRKVFAIISKSTEPECANCGCDDIRLLEVNHKNGGGGKEMEKGRNSMAFYRDIIALRRPVDDLEILCRVCNAKHYLEMQYGKLPIAVVWQD